MTIIEKIVENSHKNPDSIMMIQQLADEINILKWRELNDYSDYLAAWLDENLKTNTPVVVYGHKNPIMIICFLACVKSGRAYCPIDVNVPLSRVEDIINEVNPEIILTTETLEIKSNKVCHISSKDDFVNFGKKRIDSSKFIDKEDVFYIIFTSGSTGRPKGVQITRDCLDNFVNWAITLGTGFDEGEKFIYLNQAPFSFDLSVMDLYLCLYTGGTLWTLSKSIQQDMKLLYESLGQSKANVWVSTPSFADVCLSDPIFSEELMPCLSVFLFCGEILTNKTVSRLHSRFPKAKVINTYGPTESTCAVTEVVITEEINENCVPLPVGKPKAGTWIKIVDENGNLVKDGENGEIVIVGDSVSIGYWNNAEKNKKMFGVTNQSGKNYRYYKTGDELYIIDDMLYYGGRIDNQVKLHGYRIELEDIESNLTKIDGIVQAVVVPKYRDGKVTSLVAGIISQKHINDEKKEIQNIKYELKKTLPEYMIPKKIKFVTEMPRTNNGKIDRKAMGDIL